MRGAERTWLCCLGGICLFVVAPPGVRAESVVRIENCKNQNQRRADHHTLAPCALTRQLGGFLLVRGPRPKREGDSTWSRDLAHVPTVHVPTPTTHTNTAQSSTGITVWLLPPLPPPPPPPRGMCMYKPPSTPPTPTPHKPVQGSQRGCSHLPDHHLRQVLAATPLNNHRPIHLIYQSHPPSPAPRTRGLIRLGAPPYPLV